jgi:O-acetyl-ADP-ribose deacetylase (regulator of RNase III)
MTAIAHLRGDATQPVGPGRKILVHCCNDIGGWGAGFVLAISRRWPEPEAQYRALAYKSRPRLPLGFVQFVPVSDEIDVANLIGQCGCGPGPDGLPPIRYEAIRIGLQRIADEAVALGASVHMPKMGAGLAGGDWAVIERIVVETLCSKDIPVTVYTF